MIGWIPCYVLARIKVSEMSFLGIPDPMIWLSYVGCIACVLFSAIWWYIKREEVSDDE